MRIYNEGTDDSFIRIFVKIILSKRFYIFQIYVESEKIDRYNAFILLRNVDSVKCRGYGCLKDTGRIVTALVTAHRLLGYKCGTVLSS